MLTVSRGWQAIAHTAAYTEQLYGMMETLNDVNNHSREIANALGVESAERVNFPTVRLLSNPWAKGIRTFFGFASSMAGAVEYSSLPPSRPNESESD
jgi:hypothetical protein